MDDRISFLRQALELLPATYPDQSNTLVNIAGALTTWFGQSGQQEDVDDAISFLREAVELQPEPHAN